MTATQTDPIARVAHLHETDTDAIWYDVAVYTEEALARVEAEYRREYANVKVTRY